VPEHSRGFQSQGRSRVRHSYEPPLNVWVDGGEGVGCDPCTLVLTNWVSHCVEEGALQTVQDAVEMVVTDS
jgi:hypothetical protein